MTPERDLAWTLYVIKAQSLVNDQLNVWSKGHPSQDVILSPPSDDSVAAIKQALVKAHQRGQSEVVSLALEKIVEALDAIDNSHSKHKMIKDCRAGIQQSYDALHALKKRIESATSADAVDPVAASSHETSTRD